MNNPKDAVKITHSAPKKKSSGRSKVVKIVLAAAAILYLAFGMTASSFFGPDNVFTENIAGVVSVSEGISDKLPSLLRSVTFAIYMLGGSFILRSLLKFILHRAGKSDAVINLFNSIIKYTAWIILILYVLTQFGVDTATLLASAGILTLVIGLAAQGMIEDVLAGLFIIFSGEFDIGDIVVIDGFRGNITSIGLRTTKLMDAGGDIKIINNSGISEVINMTSELSVAVVNFCIDSDVSLEDAEGILEESRERICEMIPEIKEGPEYRGVSDFGEEAMELEVIARCAENDKFQVARSLRRALALIFAEHEIMIHGA